MIRFLNTLRDIVLVLHHQPRCCQVPDRGQAHGVPRPGPGQPPHLRIELATEFHDSFHNIRMRPRCNLREIYLRPLHGVGGELQHRVRDRAVHADISTFVVIYALLPPS